MYLSIIFSSFSKYAIISLKKNHDKKRNLIWLNHSSLGIFTYIAELHTELYDLIRFLGQIFDFYNAENLVQEFLRIKFKY